MDLKVSALGTDAVVDGCPAAGIERCVADRDRGVAELRCPAKVRGHLMVDPDLASPVRNVRD
jgi:hypothetical protein